jgi:hypothetical protein
MKRLIMIVLFVLLLPVSAQTAVGFKPDTLLQRQWLFTLNVIDVTVSPVEYILFEPGTKSYLEPRQSGVVVFTKVVSKTHVRIFVFVSPVWRYNDNYTYLWLQSNGKELGLGIDIVLTFNGGITK